MKAFALSIIFLLSSFGSVHSEMAASSGNHDAQERKGFSSGEDKKHENAHWGYLGVEGPGHWAMLNPSYMVCETGRQQSPINIVMAQQGEGQEDLMFHYLPTPLTLRNNGHTIQVNYHEGSYLRLNGQIFKLRQIHIHDPSEHHIDGKTYPMEMHLVHQDEDGHVLVVGVLFQYGRENTVFSRVGDWMQQNYGQRLPSKGDEVTTDLMFNIMDVLPHNTHHFSYRGSLTTPPCSEGVQWIVLRTPIEISQIQADRLITTIGPNARPVQSREHREILEQ